MSAKSALSVKSADPMISEPGLPEAAVLLEPAVLAVLLTVVDEELLLLLPHAASAVVRATGNATATKTDRMLRFIFLLVLVRGESQERPPWAAAVSWLGLWLRKSR